MTILFPSADAWTTLSRRSAASPTTSLLALAVVVGLGARWAEEQHAQPAIVWDATRHSVFSKGATSALGSGPMEL